MPVVKPKVALLLLVGAAAVSMILSVGLWASGNERGAMFVGLSVPSIISLGSVVFCFAAYRRARRAMREAHDAKRSARHAALYTGGS